MSNLNNKPTWGIFHHSGGSDFDPQADTSHHTIKQIDEWHKSLGFSISASGHHCGYHFVIYLNGMIVQARKIHEEGFQCVGMNRKSIGVLIMGNFDRHTTMEHCRPSDAQKESIKYIQDNLNDKYNIAVEKMVPHRFFARKTCYGINLSDYWIKGLFNDVLKERLRLTTILLKLTIQFFNILKHQNKGKKMPHNL